ncbi:MAG: hypothetical protein K1X88_03135 [Nannocystaceae bacterium]|nr:hypothetical protein [Nannocystaceae bacterium]
MYSSATTDPGARAHGCTRGFVADTGACGCTEPAEHDVAAIAARPRWALERTLALPGRCRGSVLARWADNCRRHFGAAAVQRLRTQLPAWARALPDDPPEDAWFPVGLQLHLTELVIDTLLGGDALQLEALLRADIQRGLSRAQQLLLRTVGPTLVLSRADALHGHLYDVGHARARVHGGRATIDCEGAALFGHPTWLLLQLFAHRGLVALTGREALEARATATGETAVRFELSWR